MFIPIKFSKQIIPGSFEHALNYIVDNEIDTTIFETRYKNNETGAPAYDPAITNCGYSITARVLHKQKHISERYPMKSSSKKVENKLLNGKI